MGSSSHHCRDGLVHRVHLFSENILELFVYAVCVLERFLFPQCLLSLFAIKPLLHLQIRIYRFNFGGDRFSILAAFDFCR
jgi:hypothetical protein